jgi:hypothetical protein
MGLGKMGLGEMVLGEMVLGDMGIHRLKPNSSDIVNLQIFCDLYFQNFQEHSVKCKLLTLLATGSPPYSAKVDELPDGTVEVDKLPDCSAMAGMPVVAMLVITELIGVTDWLKLKVGLLVSHWLKL